MCDIIFQFPFSFVSICLWQVYHGAGELAKGTKRSHSTFKQKQTTDKKKKSHDLDLGYWPPSWGFES